MPVRQYANAPATTLANSCTALATTITVSSTTGLPITFPYTLIIDRGTATEEAVSVTAAAGTTLTVTRGIDGTTAFAHTQSATVAHGITAQDIREANTHVNASSGVHGATGSVVGTTDSQTLTNKNLTSGTNSFPTSLVTLTGAQTLTNKSLTAPAATGSLANFGEAWTSVALTVTAEVGTITSATGTLWYSKVGRSVHWCAQITVTSAGTGSGALRFTMPFAAARDCLFGSGRESAVTGHTVNVFGNNSLGQVTKYDNTTPIVSGYQLRLGGTYEAAA